MSLYIRNGCTIIKNKDCYRRVKNNLYANKYATCKNNNAVFGSSLPKKALMEVGQRKNTQKMTNFKWIITFKDNLILQFG